MCTPSPSPQLSQKPRPHHISLLGQQLCAARWHQHSTVSEHSTTATPLPGAHAGGTRSCNPFLISQIHLFPLGKKHSLLRARTNPHQGGGGRSTQSSGTKIPQICNAKPCIANSVGLGMQHAATTQHRTAPEHLERSEPSCPVVNTAFGVGFFWLFGGFVHALSSSERGRKRTSQHPITTWDVPDISALALLTYLSDADSSGGEPSAERSPYPQLHRSAPPVSAICTRIKELCVTPISQHVPIWNLITSDLSERSFEILHPSAPNTTTDVSCDMQGAGIQGWAEQCPSIKPSPLSAGRAGQCCIQPGVGAAHHRLLPLTLTPTSVLTPSSTAQIHEDPT